MTTNINYKVNPYASLPCQGVLKALVNHGVNTQAGLTELTGIQRGNMPLYLNSLEEKSLITSYRETKPYTYMATRKGKIFLKEYL